MQKLKLKSIYMLCRKCSSSHTENNKIGFEIFGVFCDLICILQVAAETQQRGRNILRVAPWKVSKDHRQALPLRTDP
jgi:hypothetical protein